MKVLSEANMNGLQDLINKLEAIENSSVEEGFADMPPAPTMPEKPEDKARMSVNISAEGDAIEDVLKLMTKVNPDMINQKDSLPMDKPMIAPLKMLPDLPPMHDKDHAIVKTLDKDGDLDHDMDDHKKESADEQDIMDKLQAMADGPDGEDELLMKMEKGIGEEGMFLRKLYDKVSNKMFSKDSGDLEDPEDFDKIHAQVMKMFGIKAMPLKDLQQQAMDREIRGALNDPELTGEAYENEPEEEYDDVDYILNTLAGGMNRPKGTHSNVSKGDNPMQKIAKHESEEMDLRSQIKEELAQRLAQYKGN